MTSIDVLRAVHHPTRRRIVEYLHVYGPSQVGTFARAFGEQVGSVSHHLRMLERAGVVARAPELATDGRTSWWRLELESITWSVDDFADAPAERAQAHAAERLNIEHHLGKLSTWKRSSHAADRAWRDAAFSHDLLELATADELRDLQEVLLEAARAWRAGIDRTDGRHREPVFVFTHGFPTAP